ncbi:hypothetical protein B0H17DRAFT_1000430 [Mycena rosella]|uniref:TPR-like protein n=1 Tax=Mycena rosella TaxID=1033263 RepID=A0AAD7MA32_MYCRO|nr:hypothetical protein B0H17DRAFT_1000430 [Mycena rosella]
MSSGAELKAQGNALFSAKNFKEADKKYTQAIQIGDEAADPKGLAVLYANRAACRLNLKRYLDAINDAKKATLLDPAYPKAFARLATAEDALGNYQESTKNWQLALDALPKFNLTPGEQTQMAQYQAGLTTAAAEVVKMKNTPIVGQNAVMIQGEGRMPWDLAAAMLPGLQGTTNSDSYSSAWIIHGAYEDFMRGVHKMNQLKVDKIDGGSEQMRGMPGAIVDLTNGIMRDSRAMHFTDNEFLSKYNKQVILEISVYKPWMEAGPERAIQEALARQRDEGWDSVRPAVGFTVRVWIMRAVIDAGLRQRHDVAIEFFKRALDVLRSLRESWILVPVLERGVVFEKTFLFGIQHLYIDSIMQAYMLNPTAEILEELETQSDLLISEVGEELHSSQDPIDFTMLGSFHLYPRGSAYAMKGFCYKVKAGLNSNDAGNFHRKAAAVYVKAADSFPQDDEKHPWFLNAALDNMLHARSFPLRQTLEVMKRIRLSAQKAKAIWERSSLSADGLWGLLERTGEQEKELRTMLAEGKFTMDSCVGPELL